ncbi:MAG: tetratricopeptide repeat protein [Desulfobacterium sp.]|nr:tetratricopeptide repeat protein [Desulfobacterium sp.]
MAIALLDAAQKITNAPLFDIYFHKATALSSLGQLDEAKQFYEMAEKNNPGNTKLIFNMAVLYDKMKNYKDALRYYRAFLAKNSLLSDIEKKSVEDRILILNVFVEREKNQIPLR